MNADGQLGRPLRPRDHSEPLSTLFDGDFIPVLQERYTADKDIPRWQVAAGGDTSFAWSSVDGRLHRAWAWGNNEYQQCLLPIDTAGDQVKDPLDISDLLRSVIGSTRDVQQVVVGGSWIAILDGKCASLRATPSLATRSSNDESAGAIRGASRRRASPGIVAPLQAVLPYDACPLERNVPETNRYTANLQSYLSVSSGCEGSRQASTSRSSCTAMH